MGADEDRILEAERVKAKPPRDVDSNLQGVHQVIAVSEDAINRILQSRFDRDSRLKRDKRLREFHHVEEDSEIKAVLDVPRVQLSLPADTSISENQASAGQFAVVMFFLNFTSGHFHWFVKGKQQTQPLDGWSVAFRVSLASSPLLAIPGAIRERLSLDKPDAYSASQILLSLSASALSTLDLKASKMPGLPDEEGRAAKAKQGFSDWMKRYFLYLESGPFSVLGYTIRVSKPQDVPAATVTPVSGRTIVQSYKPQTDEFKNKFPTRAGLDSLAFLQMTAKDSKEEYRTANATNWIVPGLANSLAISKSIFLDSFVLKKLEVVNNDSLTLANDLFGYVFTTKETTVHGLSWELGGSRGRPEKIDYKFDPVDGEPMAYWSWKTDTREPQTGFRNYGWGEMYDRRQAEVSNLLKWNPGNNTLQIEAFAQLLIDSDFKNCSIDVALQHQTSHEPWYFGHTKTQLRWTITLALSTIQDAKLAFEVSETPVKIDIERIHYRPMEIVFNPKMEEDIKKKITDKLKDGIFKNNVLTDINAALNTQSPYVFPGGDDFFMKNPLFNTNGDVGIELSFKLKDIAIEDRFRFKVDKGKYKHITKEWIKLDSDADGAQLVLTDNQAEATFFTVDNGSLIVVRPPAPDKKELEFVKWSLFQAGAVPDRKKLVFATKETFDAATKTKKNTGTAADAKPADAAQAKQKIECCLTGSQFLFKVDKLDDGDWQPTLVLSDDADQKVQLYTGERESGSGKGKFFTVNVIY